MARYVDADELLENLKKQYGEELGWQCTVNMSDVGMMIEDATAADVVPRSEYEQLQRKYDLAVAEREANVKGFAEQLSKVESEVVQEVFGYMEARLCAGIDLSELFDILYDAKEKYTAKYTEET